MRVYAALQVHEMDDVLTDTLEHEKEKFVFVTSL